MSAVVKIESTKAKSGFAMLPAQAKAGDVAITRHGQIQVYMLSPERYKRLTSIAHVGKGALQKLDDEFEALFARMQSGAHRQAVQALGSLPLSEILAAGALAKAPKVGMSKARSAGSGTRKSDTGKVRTAGKKAQSA